MTLNLSLPQDPFDIRPKITVVGVGGAGGNAVSNMIRSKLEGVEFLVANTDAQALQQSLCERRIQLGATVTKGLGAGARPDIGRASAEEALRDIAEQLVGSNMAFITAGMGGGTGTGAAPVIAQIARDQGILTVGVVTKPFHFEGSHRMRMAEQGIQELQQYVDTLIIIPNQNLFRIANEKTTFADAFKMADEVLYSGVRGVTDLMVMPGLINLDFADIRAVMSEMGKAMMGTGEASGENRAIAAAEAAISNPLLDEVSMKGARGVLINITGGMDMTLFEVDEAANRIRDEVDPEANIIFGSTFDQSLEGKVRISVVATGIESAAQVQPRPATANLSLVARNPNPQPSGEYVAEDRGAMRAESMTAMAPSMTSQPMA
ncbi:MAG TPA: cell division protein FtsZ, partial [Terriglobales bacterium]|nr:cell division protein FtsZ [Terriglobales bacterium]